MESHRAKEIAWEEFHDVFYNQYFSGTVIEEKKVQFMALMKRDMTVVEHHVKFLALERFVPDTFQIERQRAPKFVRELYLSL